MGHQTPLAERSGGRRHLEQRLEQQLLTGDERFLISAPMIAEPVALVIILPDVGETADWPQSVDPLRRKLPDNGWRHGLSLTLPTRMATRHLTQC
jgi:hypothetical protein